MSWIKRAITLQIKNIREYPYEMLMIGFYSLFSFFMTILFWIVVIPMQKTDYPIHFMYLLAIFSVLGEAFGELFFGFRDFEYLVRDGSLDLYLIRPKPPILSILLEKMSLIAFIEKLILGFSGLLFVVNVYSLEIVPINLIMSFIYLFIGVLFYYLLYGAVTFLSFGFERISTFRDLLFSWDSAKKYPLDIFPYWIKKILTVIFPSALLAYYPAVALTGGAKFPVLLFITVPCALILFMLSYGWGLKKYQSNGG